MTDTPTPTPTPELNSFSQGLPKITTGMIRQVSQMVKQPDGTFAKRARFKRTKHKGRAGGAFGKQP